MHNYPILAVEAEAKRDRGKTRFGCSVVADKKAEIARQSSGGVAAEVDRVAAVEEGESVVERGRPSCSGGRQSSGGGRRSGGRHKSRDVEVDSVVWLRRTRLWGNQNCGGGVSRFGGMVAATKLQRRYRVAAVKMQRFVVEVESFLGGGNSDQEVSKYQQPLRGNTCLY